MPTFDDLTIERLFGAEDAENEDDDRFKQYFFFNRAYENLQADLPIRVLVGHKGIGKSALLRRSYLENRDKSQLAIWVKPNDLVPRVSEISTTEFNQLIENWKSGLVSAISEKAIEVLLGGVALGKNDATKKIVSSSVLDVLKTFIQEQFPKSYERGVPKIVRAFQDNEEIYIYIDDIDRGWSASPENIKNISALLNAIRDLAGHDKRLKFRIGLRTDVYFLVRTSDESTDKIERHVIWLSWENSEIIAVIAKRIETFFGGQHDQDTIQRMSQRDMSTHVLSKVMTPVFEGQGHWSNRPIHNVLLSLTRKRPRSNRHSGFSFCLMCDS